jgi:chromatin remodeling complex protein RSC6
MSSNSSSDNTKMSAAVKSTKKAATKTETVVTAPVVAAAAPAAAKTSAKKTADKPAVTETKAVAAPVAAVAATTEVQEEDINATLQKSIADLHEQLSNLKTAASAAANALKTIEKQAARVIKKADRRKKRKSTDATGAANPSSCIFTKPVKVTDELCAFLGKPKGTEVSRSSVTKGVLAYAKSHSLMDKQAIKPDAALRKLLTLNEGQELTILNLQKFLRRHYIKPTPAAV